ncbi:hypothetical protein [Verrucomicrobium sp. GAS474]|uniref:hypothetical protein n=1 Tax=Verrucomicrobium sp. GAS474 TaxID=1882831 RepID=UPI000B886854|nr:hypothetical protein [Verrucomicrobium sp. GAS474]
MKFVYFLILCFGCNGVLADEPRFLWEDPARSTLVTATNLVEVSFAVDDKGATEAGYTIYVFWMSKENVGFTRFIWDWAVQGGKGPELDSSNKAAECLKLLKALDQSKVMPISSNQIIAVRVREGDAILSRHFPIESIPFNVRQIMILLGFKEEDFKKFSRLHFMSDPLVGK